MEKTALTVNAVLKGRPTGPAVSVDQKACANCIYVNMNPDLTYACWKSPPTVVAAWVHTRDGSMNLQVGGARAPVERDAWCGEFDRKTNA